MKKLNCGDKIWCWERTNDNLLINGFKAECVSHEEKDKGWITIQTDTGSLRNIMIRDVELYDGITNYHEQEVVMKAFAKFKRLPLGKKKEMLSKIGLIESRIPNKEPLPDVFSLPEDYNEWDASNCKKHDKCWCGQCANDNT